MLARLELANALFPMVVTLLGIVMLVRPVFENHPAPIETNPSDSMIASLPLPLPMKAPLIMLVTLLGIVILVKFGL
jgi:hypothetical protein